MGGKAVRMRMNECIEWLAELSGVSRRADSGMCAIERWIMHRKGSLDNGSTLFFS